MVRKPKMWQSGAAVLAAAVLLGSAWAGADLGTRSRSEVGVVTFPPVCAWSGTHAHGVPTCPERPR